ncbi:Lrp/AsnC family transcriptional regulator [Candidatus Woesearchaeota archaeon]|jgi:DNA-binding Lrp family transcriptional regulator|nr:Lrp/AsnC family transcriptional regulator [Candidatus Woesearchaeota archaeon]
MVVTRILDEVSELPKLDLKDRKIIGLLVNNCRLTFSELAKKVMLSRDAVRYRINRMQELGVIQKFTILSKYSLFDYKHFKVYLQIVELESSKEKELFDYLKKNPNFLNIIEYSDKWELELAVYSKTVDEFDEVLNDFLTKFSDLVENMEIFHVIKNYSYVNIPREFVKQKIEEPPEIENLDKPKKHKELGQDDIKLDETDRNLMNLLAKNGRESLYALAEKLSVSADTVNYRIKKLVDKGVIQQFSTIINWSLIGYQFYTLFLNMKYMTKEDEMKFKQLVRMHPNIVRAMKTMGDYNIVLKVVARNQKGFHDTIRKIRLEFKDRVKNYDTLISYREQKFEVFASLL